MRGVILLAVMLLAGCASLIPAADLDADGFSPILFDGVAFVETDLPLTRGTRLHGDLFLPVDPREPDAPTRFPTILVLSPYWGDGTGGQPLNFTPYDFLVRRLVPRGYAVVFGDLVGSGGSSGCWDFMGPVERAGAVAMIEAIAASPWSDGKVGMMGISYDGMTQVMAASDAAPHLVTVVPAASLTHAYGGIFQNGVRYDGGWRTTTLGYEQASLAPPGLNTDRHVGWSMRLADSGGCVADNHLAELSADAYGAYYRARDLRPLGANVTASVFVMQGFGDAAVKPDHLGAWFDAVPTLKKAWLGDWGHAYPNARHAGRQDLYLTLHRWFDHELKGIENGIDAAPRIDVQDSQGRWRHEATWPPEDAESFVLHLSADGTLATRDAASGSIAFGGPAALPSALAPGAVSRDPVFSSAPFVAGLHLAGAPHLDLMLTSDRPLGQLIARLYDGQELVTQGAIDLLYAEGLDAPRPLTVGEPVAVSFSLYPIDHVVLPGGTLRLVFSTHDPTSWYEDDASAATLTLAAGESASLTLPTIERAEDDIFLVSCGFPPRPPTPPCWRDLPDLGV